MEFGRELRYIVRELSRARGQTTAALLILSCAIAANASMIGVADAVLRLPDAVRNPHELMVAWGSADRNQAVVEVSYRQFTEWRKSGTVDQLAAFGSSHWPMVLDSGPEPLRLAVTAVSAAFFDTLGARAAQGRTFTDDDDALKSGWVAILSHRIWASRFASDPQVVGQTVRIDDKPFTIVGVMEESLDFPRGTDLWTPVVPALAEASERNRIDLFERVGVLYVVGRTAPGASLQAVRRDFDRLAEDLESELEPRRTVVTSFEEHLLGPVRAGTWWLLGSVGALLLVACANLSALSLTRLLARRRDDAVRLTLGATQGLLTRRWLLECAALTGAGAVVGLAASVGLMKAFVALAPDGIPRVTQIELNMRVAISTCVVAAIALPVWAAAPMLASRSRSIVEALNDASRATPGRRAQQVRAWLVTAQIALSVTLLIATGLIVRSFVNLQRLDLGLEPERVLTLQVAPGSAGNRTGEWFERLTEHLGSMAGIQDAGAVLLRPLAYGPIGSDAAVLLRGQPETFEAARRNPLVNHQTATPGYFRTMRIPLLRGRTFDSTDRADAPRVVVVGERAAHTLWPGEDPIGKEVSVASPETPLTWRTVVGVVKDVHYRGLGDVRLDVYEPAAQSEQPPGFLIVRTAGSPLAAVSTVQSAIREADPRAIVSGTTSLEAVVSRELAPWRLTSWALGGFAAFTFLLALVGLVAQLSIELAQRLQEFAIRIAVGAEPWQIRAHVMRRTAARMVAGISLGAIVAFAVTQLTAALLFGVERLDPLTWTTVVIGTCAAVLGTAYLMAARAARVNVSAALTHW